MFPTLINVIRRSDFSPCRPVTLPPHIMNQYRATVDSIAPSSSRDSAEKVGAIDESVVLEFPLDEGSVDSPNAVPFFRSAFEKLLTKFDSGTITLTDGADPAANRSHFGASNDGASENKEREDGACDGNDDDDSLQAHVMIADPAAYRRVIFGSTLGAAESYIDGQWSSSARRFCSQARNRQSEVGGSLIRSCA